MSSSGMSSRGNKLDKDFAQEYSCPVMKTEVAPPAKSGQTGVRTGGKTKVRRHRLGGVRCHNNCGAPCPT